MQASVFRFAVLLLAAIAALSSSVVQAQKSKALSWGTTAKVTRVQKANRKTSQPPPAVQTVALLTLQWRVLARGDGNKKVEVDSVTEFETGDQLQLAITANQSGYLYVINFTEGSDEDGVLLFPAKYINGGKNFVKKNAEYIVPAFCENMETPDDCWMRMDPPAGTENLVIIFSREEITTLPNEANEAGEIPITHQTLQALQAQSVGEVRELAKPPRLRGLNPARFGRWVQNISTKDNEDLITTIKLKHIE